VNQRHTVGVIVLGSFLAHGGDQDFRVRYLGHAGWRGAMISAWDPLSDRALLPVASLVLVREVSCPVPGCSGGSRRRPA